MQAPNVTSQWVACGRAPKSALLCRQRAGLAGAARVSPSPHLVQESHIPGTMVPFWPGVTSLFGWYLQSMQRISCVADRGFI